MALKLRGIHRACLWGILLILSITLLAFPTRLTLEYYDMQSTRIFDNLPLFAGLFCIWLAALLILLFSRHNKRENEWEKLAFVCVFSAVFIGFWTILTFNLGRGEGIFNDAHVKYLNQFGKIPIGNRVLSYFDFPGLHIIGSFVSQVIGLDPIRSASTILFVQTVLFAALLYVLFRRFISNASIASLAPSEWSFSAAAVPNRSTVTAPATAMPATAMPPQTITSTPRRFPPLRFRPGRCSAGA